MNTTIKINNVPVKDKLGWCHPNAFVAIWAIDEELKSSSISSDGLSGYVESSRSHVIEYQGNYWGDNQMQLDGLDSRPLACYVEIEAEAVCEVNSEGEYALDDAGNKIPTGEVIPAYDVWTDRFSVDMGHVESLQILNDPLYTGKEERDRLIEFDVKRQVA